MNFSGVKHFEVTSTRHAEAIDIAKGLQKRTLLFASKSQILLESETYDRLPSQTGTE